MAPQKPETMDILEAIGMELPCGACGGRYEVTLKQVLLSQQMLHEGCPVPAHYTTECPPLYYSDLVGRELIEEFQRTWQQLEDRAIAGGRKLLLYGSQKKQ
jgi:tRNA G26 N,N-dimethylase Trm1